MASESEAPIECCLFEGVQKENLKDLFKFYAKILSNSLPNL